MKYEVISQDINNYPQSGCQSVISQTASTQPVEKEYINSMLNISSSELAIENTTVNSEEVVKPVDIAINKHADVEYKVFSIAGLSLATGMSPKTCWLTMQLN